MAKELEVWIPYAGGAIIAVVGWLLARPDKAREQTIADQKRIDEERAHNDGERDKLIANLQAELARKEQELKDEKTARSSDVDKRDAAIQTRNAEIEGGLRTIDRLQRFLERRGFEIWALRRDRVEVLEAQKEIKVLLALLRDDGADVLECLQIVEMVIAKLSHDIQIPNDAELNPQK